MFDEMVEHEAKIRLDAPGWRERYYEDKVGAPPGPAQSAAVRSMVVEYVRGLAWF